MSFECFYLCCGKKPKGHTLKKRVITDQILHTGNPKKKVQEIKKCFYYCLFKMFFFC